MIQKFLFCLMFICGALFSTTVLADGNPPTPAPAPCIHYDWATGVDGWGYCFSYNEVGEILNSGRPVPNSFCEQTHPSSFAWGRATNGFGYCFQFSPYGQVLNQGHAVPNFQCEAVQPSYYAWGRGINGYTYCFQFTPNGDVMNDGRSVPSYYCANGR